MLFVRCEQCRRIEEKGRFFKREGCICGHRRFRYTNVSRFEFCWYVATHPGCWKRK